MAAATRTPFESSRRVFVIEGADTMNDQAANRMLKTLEEPPPFVHLVLLTDRREDVLADDRLALSGGALRPAAPGADRGAPPGQDDIEPERARACARLALGDARLAARLASEEGEASAGGAPRTSCARPWAATAHRRAALDRAARRREGSRRGRGRGRGRAPARGARAGAEQGAQTLRARRRGRPPSGRAPRAHAGARSHAAPGRAVAARRALHRRRRPRVRLRRGPHRTSWAPTRRGAPASPLRVGRRARAGHAPAAGPECVRGARAGGFELPGGATAR